MIVIDGMDLDPISIVVGRQNPKFDRSKPVSDENPPVLPHELQGIAFTCEIHGGGGTVQFAIPKKAGRELRKALAEFEGVDIVSASADQLETLPPAPGSNGAPS